MLTMKEPRLSGVSSDEKPTREIPSMDISHVVAALRRAEMFPRQNPKLSPALRGDYPAQPRCSSLCLEYLKSITHPTLIIAWLLKNGPNILHGGSMPVPPIQHSIPTVSAGQTRPCAVIPVRRIRFAFVHQSCPNLISHFFFPAQASIFVLELESELE